MLGIAGLAGIALGAGIIGTGLAPARLTTFRGLALGIVGGLVFVAGIALLAEWRLA